MTSGQDFCDLTWPERLACLHQMAARIAPRFGLRGAQFTRVGDLEGFREPGGRLAYIKFRTVASEGAFLLSIYYALSGAPARAGFHRRLAFLHWTSHLSGHGILIPRRVPDLQGNLVCEVTVDLPDGRSVRCMSILDAWVDGSALETSSARDVADLAGLMARTHTVSAGWSYPPGLGDSFDHTLIESGLASIERPFRDGKVSVDYQDAVVATFHEVCDRVRPLRKSDEAWGPCHLDLNTYNCLRTPGGLCVLDFDSSGRSFFAYDIARVIEGYPVKRRRAFLSSYRRLRSLPEDIGELIETFILMNRLRWWINWADRTVKWSEWVPGFVARECGPYLAGRRFLFAQDPD